jgi:hypothetical protein
MGTLSGRCGAGVRRCIVASVAWWQPAGLGKARSAGFGGQPPRKPSGSRPGQPPRYSDMRPDPPRRHGTSIAASFATLRFLLGNSKARRPVDAEAVPVTSPPLCRRILNNSERFTVSVLAYLNCSDTIKHAGHERHTNTGEREMITTTGALIVVGLIVTAVQFIWIELVPQRSRTNRRG